MNRSVRPNVCLVTGARGNLGGRVKAALERGGWRVIGLCRKPDPDAGEIRFELGGNLSPEAMTGARVLVHCAYDTTPLSWADIHATNVVGTERLLGAARQAKVERLVCISSISAYEGCRSLYGKAKLEIETIARSFGALIIRPGLIHGDPPAGMFGRLVWQVEHSRALPLFGGGTQIQYLVHDSDICALVARFAGESTPAPPEPLTLAHEQPWTFRQTLEEIARAKGKSLRFLPVPWRLLWAGIKCAEACHIPLSFRSDSLVSLMYQNPNPSFALQRQLGLSCRPFRL